MCEPNIGIITPVKNERNNLPALYQSLKEQTLKPTIWIIIDDGSTDGSTQYISDIEKKESWISVSESYDKSAYDIGEHYARLLQQGYKLLSNQNIDYYGIVDGDMKLSPRYLEILTNYLRNNPKSAMASGGIYYEKDGELILEERLKTHPAGGATLYESEFYDEIGGPPLTPCVDSATEAKARIRGRTARHLPDLNIKAIQARPTGGGQETFTSGFKKGRDSYKLSMNPIIILIRSIIKLKTNPQRAVGFFIGYFLCLLQRDSKISDKEIRRYYYWEHPKFIFNTIFI